MALEAVARAAVSYGEGRSRMQALCVLVTATGYQSRGEGSGPVRAPLLMCPFQT